MILRVNLNGTAVNPFERYGLKQNPFPQIAKAELDGAMRQLNRLGAEPIPPGNYKEHIREVLAGWSEEFIEGCIARYMPGQMVKFDVRLPDGL